MKPALVAARLAEHFVAEPDRPALSGVSLDDQQRHLSRAELAAAVQRTARILAAHGLTRGDRLALFAGNSPEMVVALLAAWHLGAVALPINPAYRGHELRHILGDAQPRLLIFETTARELLGELDPGERGGAELVALSELTPTLSGAPDATPESSPIEIDGAELALLIYTSGTTGPSKGAMVSHDNVASTVDSLLSAWAWQSTDSLLLAMPLFHIHGLIVGLLSALAAGARIDLRRRFSAPTILDELEGGRFTVFFGVPTYYHRLLEELRRREAPATLGGLRLMASGSAPLSPAILTEFRQRTGQTLLERYGMTEAGVILSNPYAGPRVPGEVGTPLPGVRVRVVDSEGRDLPAGETGELLVAGPNVFLGYWRAPEKTAAAFRADDEGGRWLRTGDWARQDPVRGTFSLLGRRDDLILCGGFNIYPQEIEEVLAKRPEVAEAAVAGAPDPDLGTVPIAYVVAESGHELDPAAILAACRAELAAFKVPRDLHVLPALPRNALGKLQRHLLPHPAPRGAPAKQRLAAEPSSP